MNNLLHLPMKKHTTTIPGYTSRMANADQVMKLVRDRMHDMHYAELAEKVGVSPACIFAIKSGRTKWPRPNTFFSLLDVLELEMHVRPRGYNG